MAQIYFNIDIHLAGTEALLRGLNLEQGGKSQKFFTSEIIRLSDKYVPFRTGVLKNSVHPEPDYSAILYTTPYARYHWFGKLMVDPITGKGSFFDAQEGLHWSRPNTQKVLTDRDMQYQGAPLRGPFWTERMWETEGDQILESTRLFIERNANL